MKRLFTLLTFLLFVAASVKAQQVISTFKSLGHDDNVITGMSGNSSFYFKIDPLDEINGSKLVIFFQPSQALMKDKSYINVLVGDNPVYSSHLSQDSIQRIVLNLNSSYLSEDKKYLKVQIRTLLTINDDKCRDLDNPAMWLKIMGSSYLALNRNNKGFFNNVNIANSFETKSVIVYPVNPTLLDLKAAAWAYARLKKTQIKEIKVYEADKLPDSIHSYVMVGEADKLPASARQMLKVIPQKSQGLIYLHKAILNVTDTVTSLVNVNGNIVATKSVAPHITPSEIMFISGGDDDGYEKTITALGNANILNSTFGDYVLINKAQNNFFKTIDESRSKLTLRQVGGVSNFMSGIGSLNSVYNFKNSDFSFTPKEVEIHLEGIYSGLNPGDRGFFNIYLNGMLINSQKLDQSGKLSTSVTINRYQHHKYNTLVAEFRFYPSSGNCQNSFTNFFAEVDVDKSYLESKNPFITSDLSFYQYPEAFNSGTTRIVVSKNYAKYAAAAMGEIIYELNNNINSNNFPEFEYSEDFLNEKSDLKKYNIVALLDRRDPLMDEFPDAPIKFNHDFRLYNNENNKPVYMLSDSTSNGLAQIFYGRGNNAVLVITGTGKNLANSFLSASRSITEQLSTLASNVCVADGPSNKYLFNISKSSENLEYVDARSALSRFWESYNLYILLGILVLILLSFLYVRSKVQRGQDFINE